MELDNFKILIIAIVVVIILYLIYTYNTSNSYNGYPGYYPMSPSMSIYGYPHQHVHHASQYPNIDSFASDDYRTLSGQYPSQGPMQGQLQGPMQGQLQGPMQGQMVPSVQPQPLNSTTIIRPPVNNINIGDGQDKFTDPVQRQDLFHMYDPLTYPQLRLPRDVLEQYMRYYEKNGAYPPFNLATQPYLYDNPLLVGYLLRIDEGKEKEIYDVPSIPLFQIRSVKNNNRYFYYILDQRFYGKLELKIPLDHITVNGIRYNDAGDYGIPELFNGDILEHVPIYPQWKFKVQLYKTYFFP
jgi:hypothetical protein